MPVWTGEAHRLVSQAMRYFPHDKRCGRKKKLACDCERSRVIGPLRAFVEANKQLQREYRELEQSVALYSKASYALVLAYKRAHPKYPPDKWPDATAVNVWVLERLEQLTPDD